MRADRPLRRTFVLLGILTITALVYSLQLFVLYRFEGMPMPMTAFVILQFSHWYLWAAAGPVVWALTRRWPIDGPHRAANVLRHIGAAVVVSVLVILAYVAVYQVLLRVPGVSNLFGGRGRVLSDNIRFFFANYFPLELLVYAVVAGVAQASTATARLRAREHDALRLTSELATARLETLRAQLQPHFLFNTLHTIGSLVMQQKNDAAVRMLAELGDLLRETLDRRHADLIPLRDEIAHLQRYVRIEDVRFGDRLSVTWTISPEAEAAMVPSFILQPIVENAFRHGIAKMTDTAKLDIRATTNAGALVIEVYNDGPQLPGGWSPADSKGFGLRNVVDRLAARHGASHFTLENAGTTGVRAALVLPLAAA